MLEDNDYSIKEKLYW